jgi:hypothetical protein
VHGVVAPQRAPLGQLAGGSGERGISGDLRQLLVDLTDRANGSSQLGGVEPAIAMRRCGRSTRLGVDELPRNDR